MEWSPKPGTTCRCMSEEGGMVYVYTALGFVKPLYSALVLAKDTYRTLTPLFFLTTLRNGTWVWRRQSDIHFILLQFGYSGTLVCLWYVLAKGKRLARFPLKFIFTFTYTNLVDTAGEQFPTLNRNMRKIYLLLLQTAQVWRPWDWEGWFHWVEAWRAWARHHQGPWCELMWTPKHVGALLKVPFGWL